MFYSFHKLFEPFFTSDVFKEGIIFIKEGIINKTKINPFLEPIQGFLFFSDYGVSCHNIQWIR